MPLRPSATPPADGPVLERTPAHIAQIGDGDTVRRALPHRARRMVGPWCFLDHFGPSPRAAMDVATHPHIGLSTVTWLIEGEVLHKDSLGTEVIIRPGQLNWMTAGDGICHSEETPPSYDGPLHGVQLWIAAPEALRRGPAGFQHHPVLPTLSVPGAQATVLVGAVDGVRSPARAETPCVAVDLRLTGGSVRLPLEPDFEHALIVTQGEVELEGERVAPGELIYLGRGRDTLTLRGDGGAGVFLVGGAPFGEPILMWWNFVARSEAELAAARADWEAKHPRFGENPAYTRRPRLSAPAL